MDATVRALIGETVTCSGIPPVVGRPGLARKPVKPAPAKAPKRRTVEAVEAVDDDPVLPKDAEEVLTSEPTGITGEAETEHSEDAESGDASLGTDKENLISTSAALVAPDVTPEALVPLDPSAVPGVNRKLVDLSAPVTPAAQPAAPAPAAPQAQRPPPDSAAGAMDVLLNRRAQPTVPPSAMAAESIVASMTRTDIQEQAYDEAGNAVATAGLEGGNLLKENEPMPEHKPARVSALSIMRKLCS
jgi:hypothetical protein